MLVSMRRRFVFPATLFLLIAPWAVAAFATAAQQQPADGSHEVVLRDGTSFIGAILAEDDGRTLTIGIDGATTIAIPVQLVRTLDGRPYKSAGEGGEQYLPPSMRRQALRARQPIPRGSIAQGCRPRRQLCRRRNRNRPKLPLRFNHSRSRRTSTEPLRPTLRPF